MTEAAHSIVGPSSAKRWLNCPGSVSATKDLPEKPSRYAAEGTAAHTVTEWSRNEGQRADYYFGRTLHVEGFEIEVDQEMCDGANQFVEYCADLGGDAFVEMRVRYEEWVEGGFGTGDHIAVRESEKTIHVVDFKYGKGVRVYANANEQLLCYGLGSINELRHLYDFDSTWRVVLHIVQPRLDHIDSWAISVGDLLNWADTVLRPGGERTRQPDAEFKAGDWCQFCKLKATCRVRAQTVFETVVGDFEDLDASSPRAVAVMSPDEIAVALTQLGNIKRWCTDLEVHASRELADGKAIGTWKLVAGRSNRVWKVDPGKVVKLLTDAGIPANDIYHPAELKSPAQIEKVLKKNKSLVEDLIEKPAGKPTLAAGDDSRPSLAVDALAEFDNLESTDS